VRWSVDTAALRDKLTAARAGVSEKSHVSCSGKVAGSRNALVNRSSSWPLTLLAISVKLRSASVLEYDPCTFELAKWSLPVSEAFSLKTACDASAMFLPKSQSSSSARPSAMRCNSSNRASSLYCLRNVRSGVAQHREDSPDQVGQRQRTVQEAAAQRVGKVALRVCCSLLPLGESQKDGQPNPLLIPMLVVGARHGLTVSVQLGILGQRLPERCLYCIPVWFVQ
jgi:hypothetical protein